MISKFLIKRKQLKVFMLDANILILLEQIIFLKLCEEFSFKSYQKLNKDIKKIRENLISLNHRKNYENIEKYKDFCINNLEKDINIRKYIQLYFLLIAYSRNLSDKGESDIFIEYAKEYGSIAEIINDNNFCFYKEKIKKELRIKEKEVEEYKKRIIDKKVKNENQKKINISFDNFTFLIKLSSIMYLVGGVIYIYVYLFIFNINATNYYLLTDYISGSLDIVNLVLISSGFILFNVLLEERIINKEKLWVKTFNDNIYRDKKYNGHIIYRIIIIVINLFVGIVAIYLVDVLLDYLGFDMFNNVVLYLILGLFSSIIYSILIDIKAIKRFKKRKIVVIFIIFQLVFFSLMIEKISVNIKTVISGVPNINYSMSEKYKKYENLYVITINSTYIFLWDKEKKKTIIVPLLSNSNLESIEIESGFK